MERYVYRSHNAYLEAQLTKTEKCWFDGRRLSQHLHNISKLLRCLVRLSWALPKDARVLCMGVRRGLELVAWEWKGYRNVSGVELSPKREYDKIITADFSHLQDFVPDRSCDVIYAAGSHPKTGLRRGPASSHRKGDAKRSDDNQMQQSFRLTAGSKQSAGRELSSSWTRAVITKAGWRGSAIGSCMPVCLPRKPPSAQTCLNTQAGSPRLWIGSRPSPFLPTNPFDG